MHVSTAHQSYALPAIPKGGVNGMGSRSASVAMLAEPRTSARPAPSEVELQRLGTYPERSRGGLLIYSITAGDVMSTAGLRIDVRV